MLKAIVAVIGIGLASSGCLQAASQEPANPSPMPASSQRALLNRYCVTCHNERLKTAGLMLDTLDRAAAAKPNPGRPAVHRLNRAEYTNAIRDLLALDVDGASLLPADDTGYGFDNIGDVLSVSPTEDL